MRSTKSALWSALLLAVMGSLPRQAEAYCVGAENLIGFWSAKFPDLRVPVWINVSSDWSVAHTGQTPEDVARLAVEVIARHNESVRVPKLYFAGFTSEEYDPELPDNGSGISAGANLPSGITIMGMICAQDQCGGAQACANYDIRGLGQGDLQENDPLGWVLFTPPGCGDSLSYSMTSYGDMAQIMLHEIGHTLGLQHSNREKEVCEAGGYVHDGPPTGTSGVMNSALPAGFAAERAWRRDDLEGLDYLYGSGATPLEFAWWKDTDYPAFPDDAAATSMLGMSISRAAVISNRAPADVQALVTTAPDGRVIHRLMNDAGELTPAVADIAVDGSESGLAWSTPAVAMTDVDEVDQRIFVAWMANEVRDSRLLTLRTAVRPLDSLAWDYFDHPDEFRVGRIAAGYEPSVKVFVVTTLTVGAEIQVALFDVDGEPAGPAIILGGLYAFGVGPPLCADGRCLIPFSESEFGGPDFGVVEVAIDPRTFAVTLLTVEVLKAVNTYGKLSLLEDGQALLGGTGERRFYLGDFPGLSPDGNESYSNPNNDWALGIGLWRSVEVTNRRLVQPRAVSCGNGIVQADEECDDANDVAGDGCEACLLVDSGGATDEESGPGLDDDSDGCTCRAHDLRGSWAGMMAAFGLLAFGCGARRFRGGRRS